MSYARPKHEDLFIQKYLKRELQALAIDPEMLDKFLAYGVKEGGADPVKFKARMYHVLKGRTPTAYIALLVADFFQKRKYEDFIRHTIDYVEYITTDGQTKNLQKFVDQHPLQLRIVRVKQLGRRGSIVIIVIRDPIRLPNLDTLSEEAISAVANKMYAEFEKWLQQIPSLPRKIELSEGKFTDVMYQPDWGESKFVDEFDFEYKTNLSAMVDIRDGLDLVLCCALKEKAPCIEPRLLDLYYSLCEIFGPQWRDNSPEVYSVEEIWRALVKDCSLLPHVFYQERHCFSVRLSKVLDSFFDRFGKAHASLVKRAGGDLNELEESQDEYNAKPEVFQLYEGARQDYAEALRPLINSRKNEIVAAVLMAIGELDKRAQKHFAKLHEVMKNRDS